MSRYQTEQQLTKEQLNAIEKIMFSDFKLPQRFWDRTEKVGDCLLWTGSLNTNGYGQFTIFGKNNRAHRLSYMEKNGPIDIDMVIDHTCVNASCVNSEHLEMVTPLENEIRKTDRIYAKKTSEEKRQYTKITFHGKELKVLYSLEVAPGRHERMYFEFYENLCRKAVVYFDSKGATFPCWGNHVLYTKKFVHSRGGYSEDFFREAEMTDYAVCPHGNKIRFLEKRDLAIRKKDNYGGVFVVKPWKSKKERNTTKYRTNC